MKKATMQDVNQRRLGYGNVLRKRYDGFDVCDVKAEVASVDVVPGEAYRAVLFAPEIARKARPLQFVNVRVTEGVHPFLRRPFSLSWFSAEEGIIEITWAVVGEGSKMMTGWSPGTQVDVLGPLGNGFVPTDVTASVAADVAADADADVRLPADPTRKLARQISKKPKIRLVGGGTGLAPMYPLAALAVYLGWETSLFYGARSMAQVMDTSRFARVGCRVHVATQDGTFGSTGRVTDLLEPVIPSFEPDDLTVACGPTPMLRAVKSLMGGSPSPLYVSLESRMACGTGLCKGCAVRAVGKEERYYHVCSDGPVFRADLVDMGGASD